MLILAHGLRTLAIRRRSDELEELVSQRTAALAEKADELTEANTMIAESDRAKSRFLASMSHELRTPLNSIIGFTEILLERGERIAAVKGHQFLTNVRFSALHLLALINDVLDLSKVEAGKMEVHIDVVSVENLAAAVIETVDGLASPRGIRVRRQLDESLPPVYLDAIKVRQILYNLLSNAVKFSPSKAVVNLAFRFVEETESELGVDSLEITVSDQGPGIPPDQTEAIFDAYRQARDTTQDGLGTGLGLAIVRKFSEMLGGTVTVDSVLGQGSTFRVCLPVDARQHETDTESSKMLRVVL